MGESQKTTPSFEQIANQPEEDNPFDSWEGKVCLYFFLVGIAAIILTWFYIMPKVIGMLWTVIIFVLIYMAIIVFTPICKGYPL